MRIEGMGELKETTRLLKGLRLSRRMDRGHGIVALAGDGHVIACVEGHGDDRRLTIGFGDGSPGVETTPEEVIALVERGGYVLERGTASGIERYASSVDAV